MARGSSASFAGEDGPTSVKTSSKGGGGGSVPSAAAASPYAMKVSARFLGASLLATALVSFGVGRAASDLWLRGQVTRTGGGMSDSSVSVSPPARPRSVNLAATEQQQPRARADESAAAADARGAVRRGEPQISRIIEVVEGKDLPPPERVPDEEESSGDEEDEEDSSDDDEEEEVEVEKILSLQRNIPGAGQHLIMVIDSVADRALLSSNDALLAAIRRVIGLENWTVLSHHCHSSSLHGDIINCVGILDDHAHFATSAEPSERWLQFSVFTSRDGTEPFIRRLVPALKSLFVPPTGDDVQDKINDSRIRWKLQYRGFRDWFVGGRDPYSEDLGELYLNKLPMYVNEIASSESIFQRTDIFDVIDCRQTYIESYRKSLSGDDSYEATHPELFKPNRMVFLDGVLQSSSRGDEPYHEALVHPGMFAHDNPRRVAIIGGGEGATLREVLKHDTVDHVKMIDIDEMMVRVSDEYLPAWNDCADIAGSHESCFEDDRADVLFEDAMAWFIDRFANGSVGTDKEHLFKSEEQFDVIIMDALDPQDTVEFASILYNSDVFIKSLYDALADDGVLVVQLGETVDIESTAEELQWNKNRAVVTKMIARLGFESMHIYEESHCGFAGPWTFLVACKSYDCRNSWYANAAQIEREIHDRIRRSNSGEPLLKHFDGATMQLYQVPRKAFEIIHCRSVPAPSECKHGTGYNQDFGHFTAKDFEVRLTGDGSSAGVFAKVDIPKYSYIETNGGVRIPPYANELIRNASAVHGSGGATKRLTDFSNSFGIESTIKGRFEWYIDPGVYSLMRHACNGTSNIGHLASWTYKNTKPPQYFADENTHFIETPDDVEGHEYFTARSPVMDRHLSSYATGYLMSLRDIQEGEEVTTNHIHRRSDKEKWDELISKLDTQCS